MIIDGLKDEVKKNVQPIQDRQNMLEQTQADMKEQFKEMLEEVKGLKTKLDSPSRSRQVPLPSWP